MKKEWQKVKVGSVKNIYSFNGSYIFDYSDRYSIFDWGEMPDQLENKGKTLAVMAYLFFEYFGKPDLWKNMVAKDMGIDSDILELLQKSGLSHHCLGLIDEDDNIVDPENAKTFLKVKPVSVALPKETDGGELDYSFYQSKPVNHLVPLEVIFRFGAPKGSSLLRRLGKDPSYLEELGLSKMPEEGEVFSQPIIEFSTKLESADTYLTKQKAFEIAGLSPIEGARLYGLANLMALKLKEIFSAMNLELWDGKFEYAFKSSETSEREFLWIDSMGPDEIRILKEGAQLSKEFLRQAYEGSTWLSKVKELKEAKVSNFKEETLKVIPEGPEKLPALFKETAEQIYMSLTNSLCEKFKTPKVFKNCPTIDEVASKIKKVNR
jgi:phosphoribosylaminoimidazole-succinocarboxamide synthase